jgi:hypothetical protein
MYHNGATWTRHLQLEMGVVGDCLKMNEGWASQDSIVLSLKVDHLEGDHFGADVSRAAKTDS